MERLESSVHEEARRVMDEYSALFVVLGLMTTEGWQEVLRSRCEIAASPPREVRPYLNRLRKEIHRLRVSGRIRANSDTLRDILRRAEEAGTGIVPLSRTEWADILRPDALAIVWQHLPPHARLGVRLYGNREQPAPIYMLEGMLYEDMCVLFNKAVESQATGNAGSIADITVKQHLALLRAAFVTCFQFIESYLNGIASDLLLTRSDLDSREEEMLREKTRHVSFRDKALFYPKIYLRQQHPPLQESNCPELATLIAGVTLRDSLVHPSTVVREAKFQKEIAFFYMSLDWLFEVVDASVVFVRKIEEMLNRGPVLLDWIVPRGEDGLFPIESFK